MGIRRNTVYKEWGQCLSLTHRKKSPSAVSGTEDLGKGQRRELLQLQKRVPPRQEQQP